MKDPTNATRFRVGILFALLGASWCGQAMSGDLSQVIASEERVSLFAGAVDRTGLNEVLKEPGRFTLFVPSDKALADEGSAFLLRGVLLTEPNAQRLADLVRHHVARAGEGTDLAGDIELQTLAEVPLDVVHVGNGYIVAGRAAIIDRIEADNGVIYVVDRLLWPRNPRWESGTSVAAKRGRINAAALTGDR